MAKQVIVLWHSPQAPGGTLGKVFLLKLTLSDAQYTQIVRLSFT